MKGAFQMKMEFRIFLENLVKMKRFVLICESEIFVEHKTQLSFLGD